MQPWDTIIIHHTFKHGIPDSPEFLDWSGIVNYHKGILGWDDVGYHYGIERVAHRLVICPGRTTLREGAHCKAQHMNYRAIGIACVGNYDSFPPDEKLYSLTAHLCHFLVCKYPAIKVDRVLPHSDFSGKTCPGTKFDMDKLRGLIGGS